MGLSLSSLRENVFSSMESKISPTCSNLDGKSHCKQSLKQWTPVHFSLKNPTKQKPVLKDIYLKAWLFKPYENE